MPIFAGMKYKTLQVSFDERFDKLYRFIINKVKTHPSRKEAVVLREMLEDSMNRELKNRKK